MRIHLSRAKKIPFLALALTGMLLSAPASTSQQQEGSPLSSLSTVTGSLDSIIQQLSTLTGSFDSIVGSFLGGGGTGGGIGNIGGGSNMLQCIASGVDLSSMLGSMGGLKDGLCSLGALGGGSGGGDGSGSGLDLGALAKCAGIQLPSLGGSLGSLCGGSTGGGAGSGTGSVGGGNSGGYTGAGGSTNADPTSLNPNGQTLDPTSSIVSESVDTTGITDGSAGSDPKKTADRTYPSGKDGKEIFEEEGGALNKKAKEEPSSSTALAVRTFDRKTLFLKELTYKTLGHDKEESFTLPPNKGEAMDMEDEIAQFFTTSMVDFHTLSDNLAGKLRTKFAAIDKDTLSAYYMEEKKEFENFIGSEDSIKEIYNLSLKTIQARAGYKLLMEANNKDYVFDPSEAVASQLTPSMRNPFRFASVQQMLRNAYIKTKMGEEGKRNRILIDIAIQRAYVSASLFRNDIAKKEIDKMLKAVDQAIR